MKQPVPDEQIYQEALERQATLTKPPGSLGELECLGARLAAVYGSVRPVVDGVGVALFAADHGVTEAVVSAYPRVVTAQMVRNILGGGAAVSVLCRSTGADLLVIDVGVDAEFDANPRLLGRKVAYGSSNFLHGPAMRADERESAMQAGRDAVQKLLEGGANLLTAGEMGIGNSTSAAALTAALTGRSVDDCTGRGTGVDEEGLVRKRAVVSQALRLHQPDHEEPLVLLERLGGLEIAALTGFYLACFEKRIPVVVDGFITGAAALAACAIEPGVRTVLFASHLSAEPGHELQLRHLGLEPLLRMGMRLGEASGALLCLPILRSAAAILHGMATFEEAMVSE